MRDRKIASGRFLNSSLCVLRFLQHFAGVSGQERQHFSRISDDEHVQSRQAERIEDSVYCLRLFRVVRLVQ